MNRKTIFGVALFTVMLLQMGFFGLMVNENAFADLVCRKCEGGGGSGILPVTKTSTSTQSSSTPCGETSTVTITQIFRLFGSAYKLVQVIEDETFTSDIWQITRTRHNVVDYERDLTGTLKGVIGTETGREAYTPNPVYYTDFTVGRSYNLYPGEIAKLAKEVRRSVSSPAFPPITSSEETIQFQYDSVGNLVGAGGGMIQKMVPEGEAWTHTAAKVYHYSLIAGGPRLIRLDAYEHIDGSIGYDTVVGLTFPHVFMTPVTSLNHADFKGTAEYTYDALGNLTGASIPEDFSLLGSSGYNGQYGFSGAIDVSFVVRRGQALMGDYTDLIESWDRTNPRMCRSRLHIHQEFDACGRLIPPPASYIESLESTCSSYPIGAGDQEQRAEEMSKRITFRSETMAPKAQILEPAKAKLTK